MSYTEDLARAIEQFMYERGEYDYPEKDRISWLDGVSTVYDIDYGELDARIAVLQNIRQSLKTEDGKQAIIDYLKGELQAMDKGDESYQVADSLICYFAYRDEWVKDHISDVEMTATEAAYENDKDAKDMTFEEYVEVYGFANGELYSSYDEFLNNEYEDFLDNTHYPAENAHYSLGSAIDAIRDMDAGESVTIDNFMDGIDAVVTKDGDYEKSSGYMNLVTIDFKANALDADGAQRCKSIASTYDIPVDELKMVMNDIRNGKVSGDAQYLVDEKRPLKTIIKDLNSGNDKTDKFKTERD